MINLLWGDEIIKFGFMTGMADHRGGRQRVWQKDEKLALTRRENTEYKTPKRQNSPRKPQTPTARVYYATN